MAAGRGGLGRRRDPLRADRARPQLRAALLLPAADPALPGRAGRGARPPPLVRARGPGHDGPARPAELSPRPRPPPAGLRRPLAGRRRAPGVPDRHVVGRHRLRVRRAALRRRVRRAGGERLHRLRAVARRDARRRARDRVRGGPARRRPDARARRRPPGRPAGAAGRRVRDRRRALARAGRPATSRASSRPAGGCAGSRPRCACGTTPSPRSARPRGPAPTARRGSRSRSPPACVARPATACSRPRRRTRCARSARSSRAARRAPASSPGRCGASSSAASAARRWRR